MLTLTLALQVMCFLALSAAVRIGTRLRTRKPKRARVQECGMPPRITIPRDKVTYC